MTFLVDADLPRSAADVIRRHGYDVVDVRDIGLRHADDSVIASHAQRERQCLVTGDFDFADIQNYPPLPTVAEAHRLPLPTVAEAHRLPLPTVAEAHRLPQHYAGIVVLMIPPTATATYITQLLDSFFVQRPSSHSYLGS